MTAKSLSKRFGPVVAALALVAALTGCSSVVDNVPTALGGLPEGVPARPATPPAYPSVHDIPAPRRDRTLNEADTKRLREELKNTRNRVAPHDASGSSTGATGAAPNP